jgi:hypothetical protein
MTQRFLCGVCYTKYSVFSDRITGSTNLFYRSRADRGFVNVIYSRLYMLNIKMETFIHVLTKDELLHSLTEKTTDHTYPQKEKTKRQLSEDKFHG